MKPNKPSAKYIRENFKQTSDMISHPTYQLVSMTLLQTGSVEQAQSIFMQRYRQNQCHSMSFQTKNKNKFSQVNNAVR